MALITRYVNEACMKVSCYKVIECSDKDVDKIEDDDIHGTNPNNTKTTGVGWWWSHALTWCDNKPGLELMGESLVGRAGVLQTSSAFE